jgi:hypothetical protein
MSEYEKYINCLKEKEPHLNGRYHQHQKECKKENRDKEALLPKNKITDDEYKFIINIILKDPKTKDHTKKAIDNGFYVIRFGHGDKHIKIGWTKALRSIINDYKYDNKIT